MFLGTGGFVYSRGELELTVSKQGVRNMDMGMSRTSPMIPEDEKQ
jgi:hypothetical protein